MKHPSIGPKGGGNTTLILLLKIFIICSALLLNSTSAQHSSRVKYSDLEKLGSSCYPMDTCTAPRKEDSLITSKCHCGSYCTKFDTCCLDALYRNPGPEQRRNKVRHRCVRVYQSFTDSVFMINRCRPNFSGDDIKNLCVGDAEKLNDPMLLIPVTSSRTHNTYKNYFCAVCNGDDRKGDVIFWLMRITRFNVSISSSSLENINFDSQRKTWGIQDGRQKQDELEFEFEAPKRISRHVKACRDNVISGCSGYWSQDVTRRKCESYMAIIVINNQRYRNIHCGICNFQDPKNSTCMVVSGGGGPCPDCGRKPISFALLIDVNRSDGDRVGEVQRCKETELFDPFFKRCRVLKCSLPGQTLSGGRCVRGDQGAQPRRG